MAKKWRPSSLNWEISTYEYEYHSFMSIIATFLKITR
jgi:hypothetical protein